MTTGSFIKDERKPMAVVSRGDPVTIYVGLVSTKSWNGADWGPSGPPSIAKRPFSLAQEPAAPVNREFPKVRGATGRPPKRTYITDNPYTMTSNRNNHAFCLHRGGNPIGTTQASSAGYGATASFDPPVWTANDEIALLNKLSKQIAGSDFNLGVFLGEGREALKMMASSATRIYTAVKHLKKGDVPGMYRALTGSARGSRYDKFRRDGYLNYDDFELRELRRNQKIAFLDKQSQYDRDLSSIWLEAQYGWKPLLQDIHGAAAYVAERLERSPERSVRVRSRISKAYNPRSQNPTHIRLLNGKSIVSKQIIARVKSENQVALTGLLDPSEVLWELTPWSFVIDWFVPIGNYLSARSLAGKVNATYVVSTLQLDSWKGCEYLPGDDPFFQYAVGFEKAYESNAKLTRETFLTPPPVPLPVFQPLEKVASWARAANAVALLDQLRPRR